MKKVLLVLLITLVITGCGCNNRKNIKSDQNMNNSSIKINTNKEILKEQTIDGIEISKVNLTYQSELSTFTAIVINKTSLAKKIGIIDIIFKDEKNNEIVILKGLIDKTLKPNESSSINASTSLDLTSAKHVEYIIK